MLTNCKTERRNREIVGHCTRILAYGGPMPVLAIKTRLWEVHGIGVTSPELAQIIRCWGKERIRSGVIRKGHHKRGLVYYVDSNKEDLEWWLSGECKRSALSQLLSDDDW